MSSMCRTINNKPKLNTFRQFLLPLEGAVEPGHPKTEQNFLRMPSFLQYFVTDNECFKQKLITNGGDGDGDGDGDGVLMMFWLIVQIISLFYLMLGSCYNFG
jgi:hypothetical protein